MIQESEIRIGNWVSSEDGVFPFEISCNDIKAISEGGKAYAIPLTPEILEKCDIKEDHGTFKVADLYFVKDFTKGYEVQIHTEDGKLFYKLHKEILYLHQLQNLYFALTGMELKIEL